MSEFDQPDHVDLRIGDAEREDALTALGEHMSSGRLTIDEYGERSAKITASKTRRELLAEFTDLPQPKPRFSSAAPTSAPASTPSAAAPPPPPPHHGPHPPPPPPPHSVATQEDFDIQRRWEQRPVAQRLAAALVPMSGIIALVLFMALHVWWVWLLPGAIVMIGGALWGEDWKHDRRDLRRAEHDRRRELRRGR